MPNLPKTSITRGDKVTIAVLLLHFQNLCLFIFSWFYLDMTTSTARRNSHWWIVTSADKMEKMITKKRGAEKKDMMEEEEVDVWGSLASRRSTAASIVLAIMH